MRDSPRSGEPFPTATDRKTPGGRGGLRARAGDGWGASPDPKPGMRTDKRGCAGSMIPGIGGETVEAAAVGLRAAVATGACKGSRMRKARQRVDPSGRRQGGSQDPCMDRVRALGAFFDSLSIRWTLPGMKRDPPVARGSRSRQECTTRVRSACAPILSPDCRADQPHLGGLRGRTATGTGQLQDLVGGQRRYPGSGGATLPALRETGQAVMGLPGLQSCTNG